MVVVSHGAKCPTLGFFFLFCNGKQITYDILGWSAFPMSTEGMESLLRGAEGVFTWDKEENHNQESRPWLLPGGIFLSSFLTSLVGMSHSVPCNKEWCILQGIQSDSHFFITLLPTSEGLLACESIKVLPSLQVISIKHLLLHIGWGPVFWLDEGENEKGELNLHVDYWPWVICHILYISVRCTYFKSSFIQPIFVVLGSPQNSAVNKTADVLWWS